MSQVTVSNVRPVREPFTFELPTAGGVLVLTGPNQSGKTKTLDAIGALLGRKAQLDPDPDVGYPSFVEGLGVRITLGRRTRETGDLTVEALEGLDPFELVDPKIEDPARADARRFAVICAAIGAKVSLEEFNKAIGGFEVSDVMSGKTRDLLDASLPEFTSSLRNDLRSHALSCERMAEAGFSEAAGFRQAAGNTRHDEAVPDAKAFSERIGTLGAQISTAKGALLRRQSEEAEVEAAEKALATVDANAQAELDAETKRHSELMGNLQVQSRQISELEDRLREARAAHTRTLDHLDSSTKAIAIGRQRLADADAARGFIESSRSRPSSASIAAGIPALEEQMVAAQESLRFCLQKEEAQKAAQRAHDAHTRATRIAKEAQDYRAASLACESVLSSVAARASTRHKILCVDGRMIIDSNGEHVAYHVLSQGRKSEIAMELFAESLASAGKPGLLVIRQEAWEGLDPDARDRVLDASHDYRVGLVTAEAASGPLRAIPYQRSKPRG